MKKIAKWLAGISLAVFVITWGVIGVKLLDHNYGITVEAYIGLISFVVLFGSILFVKIQNRCPHCGKIMNDFGRFCPHCGKEIP